MKVSLKSFGLKELVVESTVLDVGPKSSISFLDDFIHIIFILLNHLVSPGARKHLHLIFLHSFIQVFSICIYFIFFFSEFHRQCAGRSSEGATGGSAEAV